MSAPKKSRAKKSPSGAVVPSTIGARSGRQERPYPGLRHYEEGQEIYFAGRGAEVQECADLLREARVLILHGRTGCGKSSFLRAGVKPFLARTGSPINFADAPDGFSVIRSTGNPMEAFGDALLEIADSFIDPKKAKETKRSFGQLASDVPISRIQDAFADASFRASIKTEADSTFEALNRLARAMRTPPILVIDQAEEVFTLKPPRHASEDPEVAMSHEVLERDRRDREFFRFIHMVASRDTRARLVVSLRTEYKGLFDDQIAKHGHAGEDLKGFHLRDLGIIGLRDAILRPTLRSGLEWDRVKTELDLDDDEPAPGDAKDALHISMEAATKLAKDLLSERVPVGGVLPTLQAACIRLWAQSKHAREERGGEYEIDRADLRRLGEIENQVEEYLQEEVERACVEKNLRAKGLLKGEDQKAKELRAAWKERLPEAVSVWLGALRDYLVRVEADGRAVTKSMPFEDLADAIADRLPGGVKNMPAVRTSLNYLLDKPVGILKYDQKNVTLGHDSLALALSKWSLSTPRDSHKMMMRMGMATMHRLRDLREGDLFLKEDPPHRTKIIVPIDFSWDRQLPHFAQARGFAKRLGIEFKSDPSLDARRSVLSKKRWNWPALREAAIEREQSWGDERRWNERNERVLVAAEFDSFPGAAPTGKGKDPRVEYAWRWTDVMVSDLFVGNALVGPNPSFAERMAEAMKMSEADVKKEGGVRGPVAASAADLFVDEVSKIVLDALEEMFNKGADVQCSNETGRQLLVSAARVCGRTKLAREIEDLITLHTLESAEYDVSDPLIKFLLETPQGKDRFIVGSAATRAMARQCGYHTYFGAKEIAILAFKEMKRRQNFDYQLMIGGRVSEEAQRADKERRSVLPDLSAEVQKIVSHTVWNVSIPASNWKQGLNRAFMLRLASIGYFSSEYVRTTMDDFIGYIHEFVNESLTADTDGEDAMSGQRQMRYAIKEAISECYAFLRFDEFGPQVFDLDSLYAYWSEHGRLKQSRSVAGEIYNELVSLRQKTIEHYQTCAEAIAWMRYGDAYIPSHKDISRAFRLKELAWNNFNIYNFYDSERYMSQAADALRGCMENDFRGESVTSE